MLANSLFQINKPWQQGFLFLKKSKLIINNMKKLHYLVVLLLVVFGTSDVFSQSNIKVYPTWPPRAICDGDNPTLIITTSAIPAGKTIAYYKFWLDSLKLPTVIGINPANAGSPEEYTVPYNKPGIFNATGAVIFTDSSRWYAGNVTVTIYYRPIANFTLTNNSLDTQCLNGNSFCFVDNSMQDTFPYLPSNPIASHYFVWGDGGSDTTYSPIVCHSYGFVNQFYPVLIITDDHGCSSTKINPSGHDSNGVTLVNSANPNLSWKQIPAPLGPLTCFKTCYQFKNLSPLAVSKVKRYQWDFGDSKLCDNWWEPDSNLYSGTIPYYKQTCDPKVGVNDSAHYDTIMHCYCEPGEFHPKLSITNVWGCTDSIRKTNSNSGGKPLPMNVNFSFDVTTTTTQGGNILADSVCAGSGTKGTICFKQTPIFGVQPGGMGQGFIWDFGDPADPTNRNFDSMSWTPCHAYSGMGSFFPSLTIQCVPTITTYYFAAKVVGPYRRFIDETPDRQRDMMDPTKISSTVDTTVVDYPNAAFDGQAMIVDAIDSVQLKYVGLVYDAGTGSNFAKYKMVPKNKYYGDTAYYFNTQNFSSPYPPFPTIRPDSIPVYQYAKYTPLPKLFVPSIGKLYQTIQNLIVPVSYPTGLKDLNADLCLKKLGIHNKPYYYNSIVDTNGNLLNNFWYKYSRSYNYGVRVLGPNAQIEKPPAGIIIAASQKNQCGPDDTVDFVNATNTSIGFQAHKVWRQWDFGDVYAPQCTSFSVPHLPHNGMYSWPPVVKIDSFAYYEPESSNNDYLKLQDNVVIMYDTIRMWSDAIQQDRNSDHYFINNGVTYQGRRNCNYSHDTLPRHVYPNWDSVFLWYRYGHDFMPWKKTQAPGGYQFSDTNSRNYHNTTGDPLNEFANKSWDTAWWGKPIYLNILTGSWSLWQDSSIVTSYVDTTFICNYFTFTDSALNAAGIYRSNTNIGRKGKQHFYYSDTLYSNCKKKYIVRDTLPAIWVKWPRIDTLNQTLPIANQLPRDIWPGNAATPPAGIRAATQIPDPFQLSLGNYTLFTGLTIDTAVHFPPLFYTLGSGQRFTLPSGLTTLPGSSETFFEYMFRRVTQKCITVTLTLTDSLNNESRTDLNKFPGYINDGDTIDIWDCYKQSTVQLALGKPDARGLGKQPKECPGLNGGGTIGSPALVFNGDKSPYPGFKLECGGRTSIWVDIDSLADRTDQTPCYLDGFTTWGVGKYGTKIAPGPGLNVTPGLLQRNTFYKGMNWNPMPPSPWTGPGGVLLQYHMGANSGTPPSADSAKGYVTIGVFIGNGTKDTIIHVWLSNYLSNTTNSGDLLKDTAGKFYSWNPADHTGYGYPWTYQNFLVIDQIANKTTPPPVPIPNGWVDDSLTHTYAFNAVIDRVPRIRSIDSVHFTPPKIYWDTMLTVQYLDPNWSRCLSDTVWYHNFWRIKELNAAFVKSPKELLPTGQSGPYPSSYLREVGDTIWAIYTDSVQDSVKYDVWQWSDNTLTADSFYLAGFDTTNSYYTNGIRRVRYNFEMDLNTGNPVITDSLLWPCGVYGDRQYTNYVKFYKRFWDSLGFIAPDILMLRNKCTEPAHAGLKYIDTVRVAMKDTGYLPRNYYTKMSTRMSDTTVLYGRLMGFYSDSTDRPVQFVIAKADTAKLLPPNYWQFFEKLAVTPSGDSLILRAKDKSLNPPTFNISAGDTAKLDKNYKQCLKLVGSTPPSLLTFTLTKTRVNYPLNIHISRKDTSHLPALFRRYLDSIGFIAPDTIVFKSMCPMPDHADLKWGTHGYTNYRDTLFLRMRDTSMYTKSELIDTALMYLPVWHVYHKTSWEIALQAALPQNAISAFYHFMTNTQNCQYNIGQYFTVGIIDTLHIFGGDWVEDNVFCKNEPVHFIDSLRYWRFDNQVTDISIPIWATSRPDGYHGFNYGANEPSAGYPWDTYQFDTIDFWLRDSIDPSDTLINYSSIYSNSQIELRYFQGKWTNFDITGGYLPLAGLALTGHWDLVLRGGNVKVMIPNSANDTGFENLYSGQVMFCPVTTAWGGPGLYAWNHHFSVGYWEACFPPIITYTPLNSPNNDTLNSITDLSRVPSGVPTVGRTVIYNNGKGTFKQAGMFYWDGVKWVFISNNQYTTFPFYTHRVFWDFGDKTPIVMSTKPTHEFATYGQFNVLMISRDSIGHFDTCVSVVKVMKPVAKISALTKVIGCQDPATFFDSSFVITGPSDTNTIDHEVSRKWWFTIRYFYPNGLQGQDTLTQNSILEKATWYYSQKGVFKVKLAIITEQGCMDTVTDSLIVQGPRPAFKFISDTIGCKPFRVGIWNMADSFGMRSPSDTPTLSTYFYWGDKQVTKVTGRRDTVWHTYADTGTYQIIAMGRDALPNDPITCPETMTPDTVGGFQKPITVVVKQPYYAKINVLHDTVCTGQPFDIINTSDSVAYLTYNFERWRFDSAHTSTAFIGKDSIYGNGSDQTKFDSTGLYRIILIPTQYQPSVPLSARCKLQDTILVLALKPTANFSIDSGNGSISMFKFKNLSPAGDYYQWTVYQKDGITPRTDGQKTVYPPNIDYQYDLNTDTGSYKVCLVAYTVIPNYEKCNDTICKYINYMFITKIVIPNVFTPNDDGTNDFFQIDIEGELRYDLTIYNRWGTKVFASGDKKNMWNGKDSNTGGECADGTYFYVFNYKLKGQLDMSTHGTITLIRNEK